MMNQMGIAFGAEAGAVGGGPSAFTSANIAPTSVSLADVGFYWQGDAELKSHNAMKLQEILNASTGTIDNGALICFKIGPNPPFYADFSQGKGASDILCAFYCFIISFYYFGL